MLKKYIKPELLVTDFAVDDILRTSTEPASLTENIGNDGSKYRNLGSVTYDSVINGSSSE